MIMNKKPSQMNKAELRGARSELQKRLRETLRPTRIISMTDYGCTIEGGVFPASYKHSRVKGELAIWGRGSRYSGGSMSVDELAEAERVVMNFYFEMHEGGEEGEPVNE